MPTAPVSDPLSGIYQSAELLASTWGTLLSSYETLFYSAGKVIALWEGGDGIATSLQPKVPT